MAGSNAPPRRPGTPAGRRRRMPSQPIAPMFPADALTDALTEPAGSTDPVSAPTSTALLGVGLAVAWRRRVVAIAAVGQVVEFDRFGLFRGLREGPDRRVGVERAA